MRSFTADRTKDRRADCRAPFRFRLSCSPSSGGSQRRSARHREDEAVSLLAQLRLSAAASGRLGAAASGRHHVVKFVKRNPTKCSRRGYVSVGLRSCVAAPNLRLLDTRFTGRLPRPFLRFQTSCSSGSGARKDKLRPVTARSAMRSLRDPLPMSNMLSGPEQYGKGSWQSAFPDQLSKGTLRRKKLQADPTRDASLCHAPFLRFQTSCSSGSGARKDKLRPVTCALCCAVAAKPFANEQYAFRPRAVWQRVAAVCLSILFSRGLHTLTRKLHKRQIATLFCRGLRRPTFTLFGKTARKDKNADCAAVLLGNPFCWSIKK